MITKESEWDRAALIRCILDADELIEEMKEGWGDGQDWLERWDELTEDVAHEQAHGDDKLWTQDKA